MNPLTYLLCIILAVSSVTSFPLGYYDPQDWEYIYPQLNESLVDFCFFNKTVWQSDSASEDAKWCDLLIGPPEDLDLFPDPLIRPLTIRYKDHVVNEMNDQEAVLDCFVKNRNFAKLHHCKYIQLDNLLDNTVVQRRARIDEYFHLLSTIATQLEYCWNIITSPEELTLEQSRRCHRHMENEITLVEHCSLYHPSKQTSSFGPCDRLKNSLKKPHSTIRSIVRFIQWSNRTAENKLENLPFNDVHSEVAPYRHVLNDCYNTDDWLGDPSHRCHRITAPVPDVEYCPIDRLLQSEWQRVTAEQATDDCTFYHKTQFMKVEGIC